MSLFRPAIPASQPSRVVPSTTLPSTTLAWLAGLLIVAPSMLGAFPNPTMSGPGSAPAGFLDVNGLAPNATPYCASPNYFGFWTFGSTDDGAVAGTATTGPGGVTMTLTDRVGNGGLDFSTPEAGIAFFDGREGTTTLDQPMFYSQWVFVDVDLNSEGFAVTGCTGGDATCTGGTPSAGVAVMAQNTAFPGGGSISTNQATGQASYHVASGIQLSPRSIVSRMQVDFLGAVDTVFLQKLGTGGAGFAVGGGCDPIGVAKQAGTPMEDGSGRFVIPFTVRVINNLPDAGTIASVLTAAEAASSPGQFSGPVAPAEIPIQNLQVIDDLAAVFGTGTFFVQNLDAGTLTANPGFDGDSDIELLAGSDALPPGASGTIEFDVVFTPPADTVYPLDLNNQVTASGTAQSVPVEDLSDDGSIPGPGDDNGSGGTADPTPITIPGPPTSVQVVDVPTLDLFGLVALIAMLLSAGVWLTHRRL